MLKQTLIIGILVFGFIGCNSGMKHNGIHGEDPAKMEMEGTLVKYKGAMREMFSDGGISGEVDIESLDKANLFAVAPLENLRGEITVFDGKVLVSTIEGDKVVTTENKTAKAVFAVWANVKDWQEIEIPADVKTYEQVEKFIAQTASEKGLSTNEAFPFLIEGKIAAATWHINNYLDDGEKLTKKKHDKMKFTQTDTGEDFQLLGFYSEKHQGIFTHHDSKTHIHLRSLDNKITAHLDIFILGGKNILKLPDISKSGDHSKMAMENTDTQTYKSVGIIKSIDAKKGTITVDHEDIPGYMSAMEMTEPVADKKVFESVKSGDKIDFEIKRTGSQIVFTKITKVAE